jgi:hypothetical protein
MKLEDEIEEAQEKVANMNINQLRKGEDKPEELVQLEEELKQLNDECQMLKKEKTHLRRKFTGLANKNVMEK